MGIYKDQLIQFMQIRGYSPRSIKMYADRLSEFIRFTHKQPQDIAFEDITAYQIHLTQKKVSYGYFNQAVSAIKFFFRNILPREWDVRNIAFRRTVQKLPSVASKEDIIHLIECAGNIKNKAIIQTLYSTGMRLSELQNLKISNIDSKQMIIHIVQGKGFKDRIVMLSQALLITLREYYKAMKKKPVIFLFPGRQPHMPVGGRHIQRLIQDATEKAGIKKHISPHTLRHSFATHLLEANVNIRVIQKLLGHNSLRATAIYTHVAADFINKTISPLDSLMESTGGEANV